MLKKSLLATALTSLVWGLSGTAVAEDAKAAEEPKSPHSMTGNVTFATNYVFRGLSQTNFKPAIQGTLEYGHASGLYVSFFASNASWYGDAWEEAAPSQNSAVYGGVTGQNVAISSTLETDLYAGFRNKIGDSISYDIGAIYYYYPGKYEIAANQAPASAGGFGVKKPHTGEFYVGAGWNWISAKLSYAVTEGVFGVADARGSYYGELNASYPIGDTGLTVIGHVGYWKFDGSMSVWSANGKKNDVYDLTDYKIGVTKDFLGFTFGAFYSGTTADKTTRLSNGSDLAVWGNRYGKSVGDNSLFLTVTKAF